MATLLVVDDDPDMLLPFVEHAAEGLFERIDSARLGGDALRRAEEAPPDVILLDVYLPDLSGLEVLGRLRAREARTPIIIITNSTATDTAIEAMKRGAFDYLLKPPGVGPLRETLAKALETNRRMRVPAVVAETPVADDRADAMIGVCTAMRQVYKEIGRVAAQDVTVLITGESGTGKELAARAIYQHSRRASQPFLALNCAAVPEGLVESELFGHEKGAFTGADRTRIGKFEQCNGGTLFLDEIGDMSLTTQGKMLRMLQDREFHRVGGNEPIRTDVRLLAATNRDLAALVQEGKFRLDLYYRVRETCIVLPPLRDRPGDIGLLVQHYLGVFNRVLGTQLRHVAPDTLELLNRRTWPGNIRELQNLLKQAMLRATGDVLLPSFFPELNPETTAAPPGTSLEEFIQHRLADGGGSLYADVVQYVEAILLPLVLAQTKGNQLQAARLLGVTRRTLRTKLRVLGLKVVRAVEGRDNAGDDDTD